MIGSRNAASNKGKLHIVRNRVLTTPLFFCVVSCFTKILYNFIDDKVYKSVRKLVAENAYGILILNR